MLLILQKLKKIILLFPTFSKKIYKIYSLPQIEMKKKISISGKDAYDRAKIEILSDGPSTVYFLFEWPFLIYCSL